jgi:predicted transcriptional regulator
VTTTGEGARTRIREHVHRNPGVHFNRLVRALDLAPGQVQHHLRALGDEVRADSLYGRTHYYPPGTSAWERGALALLRRETAREVVEAVLADEPAAPAAVADAVGVARSTLEWHLDRLTERDVLEKRYDEDGRVTLHAARPRDLARLVATVEPSPSDRLVDRLDRLLDDLFLDAGNGEDVDRDG